MNHAEVTATVEVAAPSRLHFGMFSFGRPGERQFGGVGAMLTAPGLRLRFSPATTFSATGPLAERVSEFAARVGRAWGLAGPPPCRIELPSAAPQHVGLGTGTQLGLAVAAGLCALRDLATDDPIALARLVQRAERSAIGTYGFALGGLLIEAGKPCSSTGPSPLVARHPLPAAWRFVLLRPRGEQGLSGDAERQAFAGLPPVPAATTAELCRLALLGLAPAAMSGDFPGFSEALYEYGHLAGSCFAANQGGPFATPQLARLVDSVRAMGVRGVGQSSWGPTLFALFPAQAPAEDFCAALEHRTADASLELLIAAPDNCGATITRCES